MTINIALEGIKRQGKEDGRLGLFPVDPNSLFYFTAWAEGYREYAIAQKEKEFNSGSIPSPNQIHKNWQLVKRAFVGQLVLLLIQYPQSPCLKFYHCCTVCPLTSARQPSDN